MNYAERNSELQKVPAWELMGNVVKSKTYFHKNFYSVQTSYLRIILALIFKHIHVIGMPSALTLVLCPCHGNLILILNVKKLRHRGKWLVPGKNGKKLNTQTT